VVHIAINTLGHPLPSAATVQQVTPTSSAWPMSTRGHGGEGDAKAGLQHNIPRC
jgi:hypothetical protein